MQDQSSSPKVVLADSDGVIRRDVESFLLKLGYNVHSVKTASELLSTLSTCSYDIAIADCFLEGAAGLEMMDRLQNLYPSVTVILMMSDPSVDSVIAAFRKGAVDFLIKPFALNEINDVLRSAVMKRQRNRGRQDAFASRAEEPPLRTVTPDQ